MTLRCSECGRFKPGKSQAYLDLHLALSIEMAAQALQSPYRPIQGLDEMPDKAERKAVRRENFMATGSLDR